MAETWAAALIPGSQVWRKSGASTTGGRTLTGIQQVVRSDAGFWVNETTLDLRQTKGRGEDQVLAYRAMMAQLDGMAGEIDVPCMALWRPYDMNGRMLRANKSILPGGRTLFNHAGFAKEPDRLMTVYGATARGATRMAIRHPHVQGLRPGHYFGIGHRLYIVARAWQISYEDAVLAAPEVYDGPASPVFDTTSPVVDGATVGSREGENIQVVDFWPRLREAASNGTWLILDRPVCRMRLASDDSGAFSQGLAAVQSVSLAFEEAI